MTIAKIIPYIIILLLCSCQSKQKEKIEFVIPEPSHLEKILQKGTLDISIFYNTTDYYVYQGVTRGFHYELAQDFANYLGVKLKIIEVNHNIDTAIQHLQDKQYDLLTMSVSQTLALKKQLGFSHAFFQTAKVLVQNVKNPPIKNIAALDEKEVFISKNASNSYKRRLTKIQDSLGIEIYIMEVNFGSNEDLMYLVENGTIDYMLIDENIANASRFSMKNIDYSFKLQDSIAVSWATNPENELLIIEINNWLKQIKKNGKFNYLYKRYFNNHKSVPSNTSKHAILQKGTISVYDHLLKKEAQRIAYDWKLLAAIIFTESNFNPEAESIVGASGLMQIIPETAKQFSVSNYIQADSNIYVGASYLQYLDKYLTKHVPDSTERIKFVLASYNAGPGHILDAIRLAQKHEKDPQIWKGNVDYYLRHKNMPQYYQDPLAKNGYCDGSQAYSYVERVLETYTNYKNIK